MPRLTSALPFLSALLALWTARGEAQVPPGSVPAAPATAAAPAPAEPEAPPPAAPSAPPPAEAPPVPAAAAAPASVSAHAEVAPQATSAGPVVDMPAEAPPSAPPEGAPAESAEAGANPAPAPSFDMLKGLRDRRLAEAAPTRVGGYGELHYNLENLDAPGDPDAHIDLHRLVVFLAHRFDEKVRFYSEIEVEHAEAAPDTPGEVSVEQAYVDYLAAGDALGVRAGIVLVPMGIINEWHEPPVFHGVERPTVDTLIIPTTWREGGVGLFGEPAEGVRYELYVVGGLDPTGFSADEGIRGGRQEVSEARADGLALTGRIEVEPALGFVGGISGYVGRAGPNADLFDEAGHEGHLDVPVAGLSWDVRGKGHGIEARAVVALFSVGDTDDLRFTYDANGKSLGLDLGALAWGAYAEVAFDLLSRSGTDQELLPFVRLERYDTMAEVKGRRRLPSDDRYAATEVALGLTYRPLPEIAVKTDYVGRDPDTLDASDARFDLGVGLMF